MAIAGNARKVFSILRKGIDVRSIGAHVRKPFRFLLCGDPALIAELRVLLLRGHEDDAIPLSAAACLETIRPDAPLVTNPQEVRAIVFLGRRGDLAGTDLGPLRVLRVPILALTVDPEAPASGPPSVPKGGDVGEYVVSSIARDHLRGRFFPHLVECASGAEIAVGRNLPSLRDTVAAKLTRDAANTALKVALASAVVDHVPVIGLVLGAFASAGDMVAITGIQVMLMLHIEAAYGRDPDLQRTWQLLPVIGGGFGWRTLARELVGFVPVAGIAIKGAIAYAGTIVVGEGVTFLHEHGHTMTKGQATALYERTKNDALRFTRELLGRLRK
ncbi:MAG: hypothetical protein JO190_01805 [Candidatus Eremiobacteraeota bacterium]|nr:hypothetical protein [Candidatus Eremiobacteraeota bacterium]MBV8498874.1 hypothetical protein [Candidatus Eremiobacteraeota bacterium]